MTSTTQPDIVIPYLADAEAAIRILFCPDQVVELRALGSSGTTAIKRFTLSGYYSDHTKMAAEVVSMSNTPGVSGVYWTLQKINPALLARSTNRYRRGPEATTADVDVTEYVWLPIDADPVRPAGISSTDAEKAAAFEVMQRVSLYFQDLGTTPIQADSGNGYHLLIPISLAPGLAPLVKDVLAALAERFDTDDVKIDRTVFNPSRILKCYGSVAKKGENTPDRPHRAARLINVPDVIPECLGMDILQKIAGGPKSSRESKYHGQKTVNIEASAELMQQFLAEGSVKHGPSVEYKGGFKWLLETCPFNPEHVAPSIIATISETGAMGFKCSHNSCFDKSWPDFRQFVETKIGHTFVFSAAVPPYEEILQWLDDLIADPERSRLVSLT